MSNKTEYPKKETLMRQIIAKYEELTKDLLVGYYTPTTKTADMLQKEIADLNEQLKQAESEPKGEKMDKKLSTDTNTVFGKDYSVVVYVLDVQQEGLISIIIHPKDEKRVKELLKGFKRNENWDKVY